MHEYAIVQALLERIEREADARGASQVVRLHVRIGELSGVDAELLATAYGVFREGTICAGAELMIREVPARWACPACERRIARGEILRCPECGLPARLAEGEEIVLDRIEMEVAEPAEALGGKS
jgi:hydrogenase nickel insertion protein HypA